MRKTLNYKLCLFNYVQVISNLNVFLGANSELHNTILGCKTLVSLYQFE